MAHFRLGSQTFVFLWLSLRCQLTLGYFVLFCSVLLGQKQAREPPGRHFCLEPLGALPLA